jgi:putative transposase
VGLDSKPHLLLRTSLPASPEPASDGQWRAGAGPLSKVMRRLMTGYAVTFNRRHKRSGHLFQNRYKSIVCEEDPYLLELIRYIHLNPLRARLVKNIKELDKYPWSGHSTILGRRKNPLISNHAMSYQPSAMSSSDKSLKPLTEATIEDVLGHFGDTIKVARRGYRQFVNQGVDQGTRPELQGGGLVRSAGGNKAGFFGRKREERDPPASPERAQAGWEREMNGFWVAGILLRQF